VYRKMLKVSRFGIIFQMDMQAISQPRIRIVMKPQLAESSRGCPPATRE
jgi:hypothetical protein